MLRTITGIVVGIAFLMSPPHPTIGAAPEETCDANAKGVNLNFTLKDIYGKNVALSAYQGKVILLDFWATWCAPCKIEIPGFIELYNKYRSRGFIVLGVSMDDST